MWRTWKVGNGAKRDGDRALLEIDIEMRPRRAAALALVDWYWLAPPLIYVVSGESPSGKA